MFEPPFRPLQLLVVSFLALLGPAGSAEPLVSAPLALAPGDPALEWGPCPSLFPAGCEIAALRGNPADPNADILLKVPGGYHIPPHWHSSAERIVLIEGELHVQYDGHAPSVLRPGSYAYGPARAPHRASCTAGAACVLFIAFELPVDAYPADAARD